MVGEATSPKVSLSAQVHSATLPATFCCALTQAARPPMLPAPVLSAPLNSLVKLVMKPAGETPDRCPPMNRITCGLVPPDAAELASYTASTTLLAWPALFATTCCCKSFAFICCSSWGLRTYTPILAGVTSAWAGPLPPSSNAPTVTTTTPTASPAAPASNQIRDRLGLFHLPQPDGSPRPLRSPGPAITAREPGRPGPTRPRASSVPPGGSARARPGRRGGAGPGRL